MGTRVMKDISHGRESHDDGSGTSNYSLSSRDFEYGTDPPTRGIGAGSFSQLPSDVPPNQTDQVQRLAGLSIGFCSIFCEQLLSHPCIILRRQCQIHHAGGWYHLTPFSLVQTMINLQRTQGGLVLWKGLGSVYIVRGISAMSESVVSEITGFSRDVSRHSSIKKLGGHLLLKGLVFGAITPFLAASLVETVQSDIASERPGIFDVIVDGVARVSAWGTLKTSRQIPVWHLALPTLVLRLTHYTINSIAQFSLSSAMHQEQQDLRDHPAESVRELSVYETFFPDLLAAFTGGLLADLLTYPMETIIHRLYVQGTRTIIDNTDTGLGVVPINTSYAGFYDCLSSVLREEGVQGLYRGLGALTLQYCTHALILRLARLIFERLSQQLGRSKGAGKKEEGSRADPKVFQSIPPPSQFGGHGEGRFG